MNSLQKWTRMALVNLAIVALLGFVLRCKMLVYIPFIDFKNTLHAHSHFAFGGWVTLALLALMIYQLLPAMKARKRVYRWLLAGILFNAVGMLVSFPVVGYAFLSILFSTLFILVTYVFTYVFIKDILKSDVSQVVRWLAIAATVYMVLSSVGPFTLAYLLATKSSNVYLYKDAIYTYLHLQYSGFFTLAVFALLFHFLQLDDQRSRRFAHLLNSSVLPSMFISYLWHYPGVLVQSIAWIGSGLIFVATIYALLVVPAIRKQYSKTQSLESMLFSLSLISFFLKMCFQGLSIIPSLGALVFSNRPVIIGFLHLVLLGFISLFLLAHFIHSGLLSAKGSARWGIWLLTVGVIANELVLFAQGLGFMFMSSTAVSAWLLLGAAGCLFAGASAIAVSNLSTDLSLREFPRKSFYIRKQFS